MLAAVTICPWEGFSKGRWNQTKSLAFVRLFVWWSTRDLPAPGPQAQVNPEPTDKERASCMHMPYIWWYIVSSETFCKAKKSIVSLFFTVLFPRCTTVAPANGKGDSDFAETCVSAEEHPDRNYQKNEGTVRWKPPTLFMYRILNTEDVSLIKEVAE